MENKKLKILLRRLEYRLYGGSAAAFLILALLAVLMNFFFRQQAANQATALIRRTVVKDYRETIYTLNDAELNYFNAIIYYNKDSSRLFALPTDLDLKTIDQPSMLQKFVFGEIKVPIYFDEQRKNQIGSVSFFYNRFATLFWAVIAWGIFAIFTLPLMRQARRWLIDDYNKDVALSEEVSRVDLAKRVRHDIASPLGALQIGIGFLAPLSENERSLLVKATQRISNIVDELDLIWRPRNSNAMIAADSARVQQIAPAILEIVSEKTVRLKKRSNVTLSVHTDSSAAGFYSKINEAEFKRCISNIIENSIEAVGSEGYVRVKTESLGDFIKIEVEDNGVGIPIEHLAELGTKGFTLNKSGGTGLGLHYAKKTIESWNGKLGFFSKNGVTIVSISLLREHPIEIAKKVSHSSDG